METEIKNRLGETLDYSFATGAQEAHQDDWLIILGHGVTGNKDRPIIVDTASALNQAGFDTLRFSFAGNGESTGNFREATISKEVGDLESVINSVAKPNLKIAYIGHSMGSAVGVLQTIKDSRVHALVSLAGMVDTKTFAEAEFGEVTPDKGLMWDEPKCPLSKAFMHDLCQTVQNVSPLAECMTIPWLLVHGTADDIVLPKDTASIQALNADTVDVIWIEGADHSFNEADHKLEMTHAVVNWLQQVS